MGRTVREHGRQRKSKTSVSCRVVASTRWLRGRTGEKSVVDGVMTPLGRTASRNESPLTPTKKNDGKSGKGVSGTEGDENQCQAESWWETYFLN